MKRPAVAAYLSIGAFVLLPHGVSASVDDEIDRVEGLKLPTHHVRNEVLPRAARLRTSGVSTDTIYVGYTPGHVTADNYWSIYSGSGPGFHRPPAQGGMWDWETALHGDSLQGWWPRHLLYTSTGGQTRSDWNRPWWAIDIGNQANYVINQGAANQRTFGVVGVWHRDDGSAGGGGVTWAPLAGGYSAWMGVRRHGDTRFVDPITNNPFDENVLVYNPHGAISASGNDKGFPGYGSQMDQMLYRDIDISGLPAASLIITFRYRTNMSTGFGTSASTRTGWFDRDPLQPTAGTTNAAPGNFISSTAAGNAAPRDSFMVYVGAPVNEWACVYSNGSTAPVYDPQRRWFSEVVRASEGLYREIHSSAGDQAATLETVTIPNATLAPMLAASGGVVRLVFRVKTNRGFDDEGTAYTSGGAGAVVIDEVTYAYGTSTIPPDWGDFESGDSIDNSLAISPITRWKSTGKPAGIFFHAHPLASLPYDDLCGQPGDVSRICNMDGVVISMGDHDASEAAGGLVDGSAFRERLDGMASPSIQLCGPYANPIGLESVERATPSEDFYLDYEIYTGIFTPFTQGNTWWLGAMSYPANAKASSGSYPAWGQIRYTPFIVFDPDVHCVRDFSTAPMYANSLIRTSNPSGLPDSIRLILTKRQECFRFGVSTGCAATNGGYFDNISLAIVDGSPLALSANIWDWFQDTFPANESPGYAGVPALFDTTSAYVKTGLNIAPSTGLTRLSVPGDTAATAAYGSAVRVDLVFRILPGPGNYVIVGHPEADNRLRKVPTNATPVTPGDLTNFWSNYLADNGPHGTPGGHPTVLGIKRWDPNVWNSARCDTAESNLFAYQGAGVLGGPGDPGLFQTTYHEADPKGAAAQLGVVRHKCFIRTPTATFRDADCVHDPPSTGPGWDLSYVTAAVGYDGQPTTVEGTKILPDGQFTPGTHVEYFFRKEDGGTFAGMLPDTNVVFPQLAEGSDDGHRWQQFGVLPDRWKEPGYIHPVKLTSGVGGACMLVVDLNDRRGNERVWVGIADTTGATSQSKRGAHNGWHAAGGQDPNDPAAFVAAHGGQPGTTWDLYQVKASESLTTKAGSIGSRLAAHATDAQMSGKESRQGPTPEMMDAYYKILMILSGDLNNGLLGPFSNHSSDDVTLITNWLANGSGSNPDRGIWAIGDGFAESNFAAGPGTPQEGLMFDYFGVRLLNTSYTLQSVNTEPVPDLLPTTVISNPPLANLGVRNWCQWTNDVLDQSLGLAALTSAASYYENNGFGPYLAGIYKRHDAASPWIALMDGFNLENVTGRNDVTSYPRVQYVFSVFANVFAEICNINGFICCDDVPGSSVGEYLRLFNNPIRQGSARIQLGLAHADRVQVRIFDLAGRVVRTLADREMPAGEHDVFWDGRDDAGRRVSHGVYFTRVRYATSGFESARKVTLLR